MSKSVSAILMSLLVLGTLTLAFYIQPVRASGAIYIRADGSIDPPTAPIYTADNITYTLTGNITAVTGADGIVIERDDIVLDGASYTLMGSGGNGIMLTNRSNVTINGMTINGFMACIWLDSSSSDNISGNNITESDWGIYLKSSSYDSISGNNITNVGASVLLDSCSNNTILRNNITDSNDGIWLDSSSNNSVSENDVTYIYLGLSNYNIISGNTLTGYGFYVFYSYHNSVENNTVNGKPLVYLEGVSNYEVDDAGQVILIRCGNITVEGLNLSFTSTELWETSNSTISGNNITNTRNGIMLYSSSNYNSVSGNNITNNLLGIFLDYSSGNIISGNRITNSTVSISSSSSDHEVISGNNIANNYEGISIGSTSDSISGNNIANNVYGILLSSSNESISGNNIVDNGWGIHFDNSSSNRISGNNITDNDFGIDFEDFSSSNSVSGNDLTGNIVGIYLSTFSNNGISGNNIANNQYGIYLEASSLNSIFHNNFVSNNVQVYSIDSVNIWDDGYPLGGNYWSGYSGVDYFSGPYQNVTGSDGIGDTAYTLDSSNTDRYPLMKIWYPIAGDINGDNKVSLADLVLLANAYSSKLGDAKWNPNADINGNGVVDLADLVILANHYGQHNP